MQVNVIASVHEARSEELLGRTVIVIDVLRATSTIVTALAQGATAILPVETVQQAKLAQQPGDLLGGERYSKRIAGFDLGNSPLEYQDPAIEGRRIVLTTTNGTRAIQKSSRADFVLAGSLLNAEACARKAADLNRNIAIVCSGTQDEFALEDGLCAGLLVRELERIWGGGCESINDLGLAMHHAYLEAEPQLERVLLASASGKKLTQLGLRADVRFCAQVNAYPLVPMLHGELMR